MSKFHASGDLVGGRYEIIEFMAEGGMQEVYRALDTSFNRIVALKLPKNPSAQKRFNRSAEMSARVTHPNVAKTLDFLPTENTAYLIEEFVFGTDLQKRLDSDYDLLDPHLAAHVIHHVAKAVATLHNANVVHRDLKPSNIMVSTDPGFSVVKVTDFGIAKMARAEIENAIEEGDDSISASSTVVGALPYMAPEVIQDSKNAGGPSDVWAIGAILFHLLTGRRPFGGGLNAIPKILARDLPPKGGVLQPKRQFKDLFDALWGIIEACLHVDASERLTAEDLVVQFGSVCYSTAERHIGTIYNFGSHPGRWGFISAQSLSDTFFHADSFYGGKPENGIKVSFARFLGDPNPRAFPVLPLKRSQSK